MIFIIIRRNHLIFGVHENNDVYCNISKIELCIYVNIHRYHVVTDLRFCTKTFKNVVSSHFFVI